MPRKRFIRRRAERKQGQALRRVSSGQGGQELEIQAQNRGGRAHSPSVEL